MTDATLARGPAAQEALKQLNGRVKTERRLPFDVDTAHDTDPATGLFNILRERMGWSQEFLAEIEDPTYPPLRDMDEIVKALHWIRTTNQKIVVMPDFDMDGISSGVLGYAGLSELGFDVELYVPDYRRGHDILPAAVDELVARHPGVKAVITCDAGVNSHSGIQRGRDHGLIMLVTDHHVQLPTEPDGSAVSPAHLVIDPERIDETYPHPAICGAFVLFQVITAYAAAHAPEKASDIAMLKLFAGLGTVSDVMPLAYENRQLVRDSLSLARMLRHPLPSSDQATVYDVNKSMLLGVLAARDHHPAFIRAFRGFAYVLQAWREEGALKDAGNLQADFYGFYMGPAFNSLRRIGAPMEIAFEVFTATDPDKQLSAAREIIECNVYRREMTQKWLEEINDRPQPLAPHVWLTAAPAGMLGLLAGSLMRETQVPTVVVTDPGKPNARHGGSARAPEWFKVIQTLTSRGYNAVGHEQACGVRANSFAELQEIAQLLADETAAMLARIALEQTGPDAQPDYKLALGHKAEGHSTPDGALGDAQTMLELARRIDSLAPFGHGFPRPKMRFIVNLSRCSMSTLGSEDTHLKIVLPNGLKMLWWHAADRLPDLKELAESPVYGENTVEFDVDLSINRFLGDESPQAVVEKAHVPELD